MSIISKIALPLVAFSSIHSLMVNTAEARVASDESSIEGAILFRIENIKPITNADGLVDKCSFVITAYNRMDKGVKEAKLRLRWEDNISAKYTISNGAVKTKKADEAKTVVKSTVVLENIAPHIQKSFESVVETDKCFLLFDNLEYTVKNCVIDGEKQEMRDNKVIRSDGGCEGNFNYVNSKNPEYYSEFKDVPDSVLAKQADDEKKREVSKIEENYKNTMKEIENLGKTLDEIK